MDALKAEQLTGAKWRVLAIPFGGPFKGRDFDGEYFDRATDIKPHWFKARPVLFHHGQDAAAKDEDYGEQELDQEPTDEGWWGTVWLNRSARYWAMVDEMLRAGKMFGSSGAIAHLVQKNHQTGHIDVWPHAEQTLTPTPANPYARIAPAKALEQFTTAGIAMDDTVKSLLAELDRRDIPDLNSPTADLPADLSSDGDAAAIQRLEGLVAHLEDLIRTL